MPKHQIATDPHCAKFLDGDENPESLKDYFRLATFSWNNSHLGVAPELIVIVDCNFDPTDHNFWRLLGSYSAASFKNIYLNYPYLCNQ